MIESNGGASDGRDGLLYDWFKHLTSLSLLTLGGILSLSQTNDADIKKHTLVGVLIAVGASGVLGFSGAEQIVQARTSGKPLPAYLNVIRQAASALLGLGVGAFLYIFIAVVY
jgi:hypothetical protein